MSTPILNPEATARQIKDLDQTIARRESEIRRITRVLPTASPARRARLETSRAEHVHFLEENRAARAALQAQVRAAESDPS